jgi:hypothetical protein
MRSLRTSRPRPASARTRCRASGRKGATAGQEILDELGEVNAIVTAKATPEEAAGFREYLLTAAQRAADAAKEGGFMGFGAKQVSEGEETMLARLREVLA